MPISVSVSKEQIDALELAIGPKSTGQAVYQAIRRTTVSGAVILRRRVGEKLAVDRKYIVRAVSTKMEGSGAGTVGHVLVQDDLIPLIAFQDRKAGRQGGIVVIISKDRLPLYLRHAFYATVKTNGGNHKGIFLRVKGRDSSGQRKGGRGNAYIGGQLTASGYARRLPIQENFGPNVVDVFGKARITKLGEQIMGEMGATLEKNLQSQLERFQGGKTADLEADAMAQGYQDG